MNEAQKKLRETNPRQQASIFSIVFFIFTTSIFGKRSERELQEEDVYEALNNCKANKLGAKLESAWRLEKCKTKPWIFRSLFKIFGWEWVSYGVIDCVTSTTLLILRPIAVGKVVLYFSKGQTQISKEMAYFYAAVLIGSTIMYTMYLHCFTLYLFQLAIKMRISCCSLIYRKALKLNSTALKEMTCGRVVTLLTKDVHAFDNTVYMSHCLWVGLVRTTVTTYVMYQQIGISAVYGIAVLILLIPVHGKSISTFRLKTTSKTDKRVRLTQEILAAIRIIKMYTWERYFETEVNSMRKQEVKQLKLLYYIKALALSLANFSVRLALYVCLVVSLVMGKQLTAEKAFVVVGCFSALRVLLTVTIPVGMSQVAEAIASLKRITDFLSCDEVMPNQLLEEKSNSTGKLIVLQNVSATPDGENLVIQNLNLEIQPGLTAITGPVGCGKSTLLKLILKDLPVTQGSVTIHGTVSYASQQPWLFPSSVKQNIVFGEPLNESRYQNVVRVCALRKDLESFPYGDATHVTDKGLNLSSGQKARINLARAVYKRADIYLLDDTLSAVDAHVGKYIFQECLQRFLKNKLCVVVTHQTACLEEFNDIIVLKAGHVQYRGDCKKNIERNGNAVIVESNNEEHFDQNEHQGENLLNEDDHANESSKLLERHTDIVEQKSIYQEKKQEGSVKKEVYKDYVVYGGRTMMLLTIVLSVLAQAALSLFDYFVSYWVDLQESLPICGAHAKSNTTVCIEAESSQTIAICQFTIIVFGSTVLYILSVFALFTFFTNASLNIHNAILNKLINTSILFFDTNMSGNIINRLSRDLGVIDDLLPNAGLETAKIMLMVAGIFFLVSCVNPVFLVPSTCLVILLFQISKYYLRTGRSLKRLEGATRSPVIGHLNASMEGLTTIRASKAQSVLEREFDAYLDTYNSASYMEVSTSRAFGFVIDSVCSFYVVVVVLSYFTFLTNTGGSIGLVITQSLTLTAGLQWGVRQWAEFETQMTSVERALEYTKIKPEQKSGHKPEKWPTSGKIQFKAVSLKYSKSSEQVLKDITFSIESKQKIGIVGRTGAGKSSIISVLFNLYDFTGCITVDQIDIKEIDVDLLRSKIAIIPQDPVLFTDTLRKNLDPKNERTDKELWDALEEVEMKQVLASTETGLDSNVLDGGANFSVGQRQLLCLTRAILRKNNIIVLDEATANIDPQTDYLIQKAIRKNFTNCTVITVAHRLHTIFDSDKVLVMDSGRIIEYDGPKELLKNKNGVFYGMVAQSSLLS